MRIIDADALIDRILTNICKPCKEERKEDYNGVRCRACQYGDEIDDIEDAPTIEPQKWIPCSERLPDDLEEVNITWVNTDPEPYYDFMKGKPATGSAVYYKGKWYWYSSVTVDVLAEYGRMESEELDKAIEVIAWMPLPEPWRGE